jgi:flagellar biosynthesis/type III secretory pathway chaperone
MAMHLDTDGLQAVLTEQIRCAEAMLEALERENAALVAGDPERLNAASADKARLVGELEHLEAERRDLTAAIGAAAQAANGTAASRPEWQKLLDLIAACKARNESNGTLVKARTEQVRAALKLLRGNDLELYAPEGVRPATRAPRPLGTA